MNESTVLTRRTVLGGCGAACAAALTACAGYGAGGPVAAPAPAPAGAAPAAAGAAPAVGAAPGPAGGAVALASVSEVPVGGGVVLAAQGLVVTQPTAGTFKAFSATCTHQGCAVNEVAGGTINCPCHGSRFAVADGAPTAGPAKRGLAEKAVTVRGSSVVLA